MSFELQIQVDHSSHGRIMAMDSAYHVTVENWARDVVVNSSYCGVLPARFIGRHKPRGTIGVDCAVGPAGAAIAGLWYLEALNIPAAAANVDTVLLGDGVDLYTHGIISYFNRPAQDCGVALGMPVRLAARAMLDVKPETPDAEDVTNRTEQYRNAQGRAVICVDSIAFGRCEDQTNVLVTAGHTGRSALPYLLKVSPYGFVCSDGGMGRNRSGIVGLFQAGDAGIPGATVDARTARMGDGLSSYRDGIISAVNPRGAMTGVELGMPAALAAKLLTDFEP